MNAPKNQTEFPQTPFLISKKTRHRNNVLVGVDKAQVRFVEQLLGLECQRVERIKDEDLLGRQEHLLLAVNSSNCLELSPDVIKKTGIWSVVPLEGGSAGTNALVRAASTILGEPKPEKDRVEQISSDLCRDGEVEDVRGSLWDAAWRLTGEPTIKETKWVQPWDGISWISKDVDIHYRLNGLYRDLVGYVFAREDDLPAAKKFGISPSRFNRLRQLTLSLDKVELSIKTLSKWRTRKSNPFICALMISKIWA